MDILWSPWRSKYIQNFKDEEKGKIPDCFICEAINSKDNDEEFLIAARRKNSIVIMNRFPYNSGHLLIAANRHVGELSDLTDTELVEMMKMVTESTQILKKLYIPHGFNVGINIGRVAGAGVPGHLHIHVVPRWNGDSNFMPVLSETKVVSEDILVARKNISEAFINSPADIDEF